MQSESVVQTGGPEFVLSQVAETIARLGHGYEREGERVEDLRAGLKEGRFQLAVLGQFKRGKSTLLNALLGEEALPVALLPATALPVFIRSGPRREARIDFLNGRRPEHFVAGGPGELARFLARFVTQDANPENRLGVSRVDVFHPASILRNGLVLIDTPGVGSTFTHNTETTLAFVPQCDAAVFVVSADPPITQAELTLLRHAREKAARLFLVLNKSDLLRSGEREEAAGFLLRVARENAGLDDVSTVYCVSARGGLEARRTQEASRWMESGMAALEDRLLEFATREKSEALQEAVARKTRDLIADMRFRLDVAVRSYEMPIEDLEKRLAVFKEKAGELDRERIELRDLLEGDCRRLTEFLETQAAELRNRSVEFLKAAVSPILGGKTKKETNSHERTQDSGAAGTPDEDAIRAAIDCAIPAFFAAEMPRLTAALDERLAEVLRRHEERARALAECARRTAADIFNISWRPLDPAGIRHQRHEPYWVTRDWSTALGALPAESLWRLLPGSIRRRRFERRLASELESLAARNVENARWAALRNLDDTFRRTATEFDERLGETLDATRGAIRAALDKRRESASAAELELPALRRAADRLERLQNVISIHSSRSD